MTSLISGYNISSSTQQAKYNIDELTKQVGNFVYGLSFIMIGLSFSLIIFPSNETIIMMIGPIILVIYIILGLLFLNLNKRQIYLAILYESIFLIFLDFIIFEFF